MRKVEAVVFDVDGVLTTVDSVWQFIHTHLGTTAEASRYREMYRQGEITYEQWALLDASLWKGVSEKRLKEIVTRIRLRDGARELLSSLKARGIKTAAISAGLDIVTKYVCRKLGIDECVSNRLVFRDGVFTGGVEVLVEYNNKGEVLRRLARSLGVELENTIAVGDSEIDISMFRVAGISVAFNPANRRVEEQADYVIKSPTLYPLKELLEKILDC